MCKKIQKMKPWIKKRKALPLKKWKFTENKNHIGKLEFTMNEWSSSKSNEINQIDVLRFCVCAKECTLSLKRKSNKF